MKKLLLILPFLIISLFSLEQTPFPNTIPLGGAPKTLSTVNGGFKPLGGYVNLVFADTTAANLQPYLPWYDGAFIQTIGGISWNRYHNAWIKVNGGGSGSISLTTTGSTGAATLVGSTLNIPNYDINIQKSYTTTTQLSDTSWVWCRFNGTCDTFRIVNTGGGSGGGSPAGNYNDVQVNRNGGFATPLLDSLLFSAGLSVKGTGTFTGELIANTNNLGIRMGQVNSTFAAVGLTKAPLTLTNFLFGGDTSIAYIQSQSAFNGTINNNNRFLINSVGFSLYPNNYNTASAFLLPPGTTSVAAQIFNLTSAALLTTQTAGALEAVGNIIYYTGADLVRRPLLSSNTGWSTTGNSGTTVASNFIGTTDNIGLKFKVNNIQSGYIDLVKANTSFGDHSTVANTNGQNNTGFGRYTLNSNTTGNSNTAVGSAALSTSITQSDNTAIGKEAMLAILTGESNVAVGSLALGSTMSGTSSANSVVGASGLFSNTNSSDNALVGYQAFYNNTTGSFNAGVGSGVGGSNITGSRNTFLGYGTSGAASSTRSSIGLGYQAAPSNNQFYVSDSILRWKSKGLSVRPSSTLNFVLTDTTGAGDLVLKAITSSQWTTVGAGINYSGGNVGINDATPSYALDVNGEAQITSNVYIGGTMNATTGIYTGGNADIVGDAIVTGNVIAANLASGTYTPTVTDIANITSHTVHDLGYTRNGNSVTVYGVIGIRPSSNATVTQLSFTLPIGSNFSADDQAGGTGWAQDVAGLGFGVTSISSGTELLISFVTNDTGSRTYTFTSTYQIIP